MVMYKMSPVGFDWDEANKEKNWVKHRVTAEECEQVFTHRPLSIVKDVKHSEREDRFIALGITRQQRVLYVVFTIRESNIRVISARDQNRRERRFYEEAKG